MNRQNLLIGLALAAGAFFLVQTFLLSGSKATATVSDSRAHSSSAAPRADLEPMLAGVQQLLAQQDLGEAELYRLECVDRPWACDPFERLPEAVAKDPAQTEAVTELVYSGYLDFGARKLGIINGEEYAEGEAIGETGFIVRRITPQEVVVSRAAGAGAKARNTRVVAIQKNMYDVL